MAELPDSLIQKMEMLNQSIEVKEEDKTSTCYGTGYDCEFVSEPPTRSECPICLHILREPQQATCCGKIFCKACICRIKEKKQACPTCKEESFDYYPDKGLQQELYNCKVYCTKKPQRCDWVGELRDLDQHLNLSPSEEDKFNGCQYVRIKCSFCEESFKRHELGKHETKECVQRPYSCELCEEYFSTYDDVVFTHLSTCKCRQVKCPNECGDVVEYHKLDEHLSSHCSLSEIDCEFSHSGCEVKVLRKDLSSHKADNMTSHMSLLAADNQRLKSEVINMKSELIHMREGHKAAEKKMINQLTALPPLHFRYPWTRYMQRHYGAVEVINESPWYSRPFYTHHGGYMLRLKIYAVKYTKHMFTGYMKRIHISYEFLEEVKKPNLTFAMVVSCQNEHGTTYARKVLKCDPKEPAGNEELGYMKVDKVTKGDEMSVCVNSIELNDN